MSSRNQGIVHVIGPELGITQPGQTIVCGDSHTSTHGAFGALAFGIGTSEVEHVLATQCLLQAASKTHARGRFNGKRPRASPSKDMILAIIGKIGIAGGTGHVIEYAGEAIRGLSMEARMTICNMTIEGGARAGMVAPDDTTFAYLEGRPFVPRGKEFQEAVERWKSLASDPGAKFDATVNSTPRRSRRKLPGAPIPAWSPASPAACPIRLPFADPDEQKAAARALEYMALRPGTPMVDIPVDRVFIGSCTNSRMEDLRAAARVVRGKHVAKHAQSSAGGARLARGQSQGRKGRPRPHFPRRRIRVARCRMQHVHRHE